MFGKIKYFNQDKKFGFIHSTEQEGDFFFHISSITADDVKCVKDEEVEFDVIESKKKPGTFEALNIRRKAGYIEETFRPQGHPSDFLFQWSYTVLDDQNNEGGSVRKGVLHELAELALDEDWSYGNTKVKRTPFPILRNYLVNTFYKLYQDKCVYEVTHRGENWAAFNTGLVNELYDPIYALFEKNTQDRQPWKFYAFCCANIGRNGQTLVRNFNPLPTAAKYFTNAEEVIFDPDVPIAPRYDHIVYDSIERGRYPVDFLRSHTPKGFKWQDPLSLKEHERKKYLRDFREAVVNSPRSDRDIRNRIDDAIELAVKRARWNFKTAIPLFYPRQNRISLLLPIALVNDDEVDLALVVSRTAAGGYSGETVFKLKWAYDHARLVCRPDSDWLTPQGEAEEDEADEEVPVTENKTTHEADTAHSKLKEQQLVICPSCGKKYSLSKEKLGESPRNVRCTKCKTAFVIYPE